jgi:hypothetical protein
MNRLLNRIKWAIWPYIAYRKIVGGMRPWDYMYILKMLRFQLMVLAKNIEQNKRHAGHESTVKEIMAVTGYLEGQIKDNHAERCGFDSNWEFTFKETKEGSELLTTETEQQKINNERATMEGIKLSEKEWGEMFDIMKENMDGWWD